MECVRCKATNPDGKKFCGDCGAPLDPTENQINSYLESNLGTRIQAFIKEQYKDQKIIEIEATEAVVTKLANWAKLLGFFVGIPLALIALILGFLGIRTYSDFSLIVDTGKKEIAETLDKEREKAQQQANIFKRQAEIFKSDSDQLAQKSEELKSKYQQLKNQLSGIDTLAKEVKSLATKVEKIEERIGVRPSAFLTPDLQKNLENSFTEFRTYLISLGFKPRPGKLQVSVDAKYEGTAIQDNAIYIPHENRIIISPSMAGEKQVMYYIYTLHALGTIDYRIAGSGLQSGLADYFACSFSNNPLLGEEFAKAKGGKVPGTGKPYLRNLKNRRTFTELDARIPAHDAGAAHDAGEVWGGAFWELREQIGQSVTDKLLFSTWSDLKVNELKGKIQESFVKKLLEMDRSLEGGKYKNQISLIFERRK